jgi:hypothetical protein
LVAYFFSRATITAHTGRASRRGVCISGGDDIRELD